MSISVPASCHAGVRRPEIRLTGFGGAPNELNRVLKIDNAVLGGENYCKVLLHFGGRICWPRKR